MLFNFETRPSDSPFVETFWKAHNEQIGEFTSIAASHWELVITRHEGKLAVTVRGPETEPTPVFCSMYGEWVGIIFKPGTIMPKLPASRLVNGSIDLPGSASQSFWLDCSAWEIPNYENADTFVARLVRQGLVRYDPIVHNALRGHPQDVNPRSVQRHFLQTTGLTHGTLVQIERARLATLLLQEGLPILDVVEQAGYADQPHLTRALGRYIGKTPARIRANAETEPLSLLFKTTPPDLR